MENNWRSLIILNALNREGDAIVAMFLKLMKNNSRLPYYIENKELHADLKAVGSEGFWNDRL